MQLTPLALFLLALPAAAQFSADPAVNLAVADAAGDQVLPKVAPTPDGGAFVSWFDGIAGGYDVRAQKLDLRGREVMPHGGVLVADRGFSSVQDHGLAVTAGGDAVLAFRDDSGAGVQVAVAKVSPAGALLWSVQVSSTTGFVASPRVAGAPDGGAYVAWTQDATTRVQRLDASGAPVWPADVVLTPGAGTYSASDLRASDGGAILAFVHQTGGFGSPRHLLAQKLDPGGNLLWGAGHVTVFDGGSLQFGNFPTLVTDGAGGAVFAWYDAATLALQCRVQRVLADGSEAFTHDGVEVSTDSSRVRVSPHADIDPQSGEVVVAWTELSSTQSQQGVYAQKLDASGARLWGAAGAAVVPLGAPEQTQVRALASAGGAFVFWASAPGFGQQVLRAARVASGGSVDLAPYEVASTPSGKSRLFAVRTEAEHALLAWSDSRSDAGDVLAQNVNPDGSLGNLVGTPYCFGQSCPCANDDPHAGCANGTGAGARLEVAAGGASVAADDLVLAASGVPALQPGLVFLGGAQASLPFGGGLRCVGAGAVGLQRFPVAQASAAGVLSAGPGLAAHSQAAFPPAAWITAGATRFFQAWYRDPASPCGASFGLSNGLAVVFGP